MVMFDLPVVADEDRRQAARFRKELMDQGFEMMQESIYTRYCVTQEKLESVMAKVRHIAPARGKISCLFVTEKQWQNIENIFCWEYIKPHHKIAGEKNADQLTFW